MSPEPIHRRCSIAGSIPPPTNGTRWVVSDIHGCARTFDAFLDRIALTRSDQLFLLGDYVNKGPASRAVLERLFELEHQGYTLFPLRGNHEQKWLDAAPGGPAALAELAEKQATFDLLGPDGCLEPTFKAYFEGLPYVYELDTCFLVHAGFNFAAPDPFADFDAMLEIRDFGYDPGPVTNKEIIHGHNPFPLSYIRTQLQSGSPVLPLDNGCVYFGERPDHGRLLGLDPDTHTLIVQPNVEAA